MWEKCIDFSNIMYLMNTFLLSNAERKMKYGTKQFYFCFDCWLKQNKK